MKSGGTAVTNSRQVSKDGEASAKTAISLGNYQDNLPSDERGSYGRASGIMSSSNTLKMNELKFSGYATAHCRRPGSFANNHFFR